MNTLKMSNNYPRILSHHHLHPYFDFESMKFVKDRIKGIVKTKMYKIESKMKEVMDARRNILDAEKRKTSDYSVCFASI